MNVYSPNKLWTYEKPKENYIHKPSPNIIVGKIYDILQSYLKRHLKLENIKDENLEKYTDVFASESNAAIQSEQDKLFHDSNTQIQSIFDTTKNALAVANFVNIEALTADRYFFEPHCAIKLSPAEVQSYVDRYQAQGNFSMLRMIKDYISRYQTTKENPDNPYAFIKITMPSDMLAVYQQVAESALSLTYRIHKNDFTIDSPTELLSWMDADYSHGLYDVIGDGTILSSLSNRRVPDSARHAFDNVTLKSPDSQYLKNIAS